MVTLKGVFINFKPNYARDVLEQAQIPYEEWSCDGIDEIEVRVDLYNLESEPTKKEQLRKIAGLDSLQGLDYIIFY